MEHLGREALNGKDYLLMNNGSVPNRLGEVNGAVVRRQILVCSLALTISEGIKPCIVA